jgi:HD-GYP domain-containing protein (c-di-GMP phosphodiesterase class II)
VGKVCIPESVLLAPGPLTPGEYEVVKTHAALGAQVVATVLASRQVSWVRHHHERWDGRGYPDGLYEEEIPEGSAILAVADAWDAMTHRAWAGEALTEPEAIDECRCESGAQFAPWAVDALERVVGGLPPELAGVRAIAPLQLIPA